MSPPALTATPLPVRAEAALGHGAGRAEPDAQAGGDGQASAAAAAPRAFSARRFLPLLLGLVSLLVLLPVMTAGYFGARDNTSRLLSAKSDAILDGLENQLRGTIEPVAAQMGQVARYIAAGRIDPADRESFRRFMLGVVSGQSSVIGIGFLEESGPFRRWPRYGGQEVIEERANAPFAAEIWASAAAGEGPRWHAPFVSRITRAPVLLHRQPVIHNGRLVGVFMTALTSELVSDYVTSMREDITPFVLMNRETVVLHPNLRNIDVTGTALPGIGEVGDPALARMWRDLRQPFLVEPEARSRTHWSWTGDGYLATQYHYREIMGLGAEPWIIGFHQDSRATMRERWVVLALLYGSGAALVLVVLAAWRIGVQVARPAADVASAARKLEALDFDGVRNGALAASRIKEVRDTAHALDRAALTLRRVQTYVPRALIARLLQLGDDRPQATQSEVTILFMDLAGYTAWAEGRSALDVAAYLNGLFAEIGPIIEAHGGTIDKYTGDGLLAVWGAPLADPDHARQAWAGTRAVQRHMAAVIAAHGAEDPRACRMRLGLHSGLVIAGDLGFAGRMDYTVIGRTVNTAQRTQALLKPHMGDDWVGLAITESVRRRLDVPMAGLVAIGAVADETVYQVRSGDVSGVSPG
jgi:class 3 adenylate cyclase